MQFRKITAIVRTLCLNDVEREVEKLGVHMSITAVKGRGEYVNYLNPSELERHARIEIFSETNKVEKIVAAILEAASSGMPGDGIIAVLPVERVYRIRTKQMAASGQL